MLCITFLLIAITSGYAQLFSADQDLGINVVSIPSPTPSSNTRIIGGSPTTIQNYPFTVQVLYNSQLQCAGTLLTKNHVLSAAHCFVDLYGVVASPTLFSIRVGTTTLNFGGTVHAVAKITVHERYNQPLRNNDVAVVLLNSSVVLSTRVQTALIPMQGQTLVDNTTVVAVGWGRTIVNVPSTSTILNEVSIRTVNRTVCKTRYDWLANISGQPFPVTENMLCAGLLDVGGADACQGDSGGPLVYGDIVVGVTSWGYSCAEPMFPGVYAKVSQFTSWINATVIDQVFNITESNNSTTNSTNNTASSVVSQRTLLFVPVVLVISIKML